MRGMRGLCGLPHGPRSPRESGGGEEEGYGEGHSERVEVKSTIPCQAEPFAPVYQPRTE